MSVAFIVYVLVRLIVLCYDFWNVVCCWFEAGDGEDDGQLEMYL